MKLISILFLLSLVSVNCDFINDIKCQTTTSEPCDALDSDYGQCLTDYQSYQACLGSKNCSSISQSQSEYVSCIQKCNSSNPKIQKYIVSFIDCINSSYLMLLSGILAILIVYI